MAPYVILKLKFYPKIHISLKNTEKFKFTELFSTEIKLFRQF